MTHHDGTGEEDPRPHEGDGRFEDNSSPVEGSDGIESVEERQGAMAAAEGGVEGSTVPEPKAESPNTDPQPEAPDGESDVRDDGTTGKVGERAINGPTDEGPTYFIQFGPEDYEYPPYSSGPADSDGSGSADQGRRTPDLEGVDIGKVLDKLEKDLEASGTGLDSEGHILHSRQPATPSEDQPGSEDSPVTPPGDEKSTLDLNGHNPIEFEDEHEFTHPVSDDPDAYKADEPGKSKGIDTFKTIASGYFEDIDLSDVRRPNGEPVDGGDQSEKNRSLTSNPDYLASNQILGWRLLANNAKDAIVNPTESDGLDQIRRDDSYQAGTMTALVLDLYERQRTERPPDADEPEQEAWEYTSADGSFKASLRTVSLEDIQAVQDGYHVISFNQSSKWTAISPLQMRLQTSQPVPKPDMPTENFMVNSDIAIMVYGDQAFLTGVKTSFSEDDGSYHASGDDYDGQSEVLARLLPPGTRFDSEIPHVAEVVSAVVQSYSLKSAWVEAHLAMEDSINPRQAEAETGTPPALSVFESRPDTASDSAGLTTERDALMFVKSDAFFDARETIHRASGNFAYIMAKSDDQTRAYTHSLATIAELAAAEEAEYDTARYVSALDKYKQTDGDSVEDSVMTRAYIAASRAGIEDYVPKLRDNLKTEQKEMAAGPIIMTTQAGDYRQERFPLLKAVVANCESLAEAKLWIDPYTDGIDNWAVTMHYLARQHQSGKVSYSEVLTQANKLVNNGAQEFEPQEVLDNAPDFISSFHGGVMRGRFYDAIAISAEQVEPTLENLSQIMRVAKMAAAEPIVDSNASSRLADKYSQLITAHAATLAIEYAQTSNIDGTIQVTEIILAHTLSELVSRPDATAEMIADAADDTIDAIMQQKITMDTTVEDLAETQERLAAVRDTALRQAAVAFVKRGVARGNTSSPLLEVQEKLASDLSSATPDEVMKILAQAADKVVPEQQPTDDAQYARQLITSMALTHDRVAALIDCWAAVTNEEQLNALRPTSLEQFELPSLKKLYEEGIGYLVADDPEIVADGIVEMARNLDLVNTFKSKDPAAYVHMVDKLVDRLHTLSPESVPAAISQLLPVLNNALYPYATIEHQRRFYNMILASPHSSPQHFAALRYAISGTCDKPLVQAEALIKFAAGKPIDA